MGSTPPPPPPRGALLTLLLLIAMEKLYQEIVKSMIAETSGDSVTAKHT